MRKGGAASRAKEFNTKPRGGVGGIISVRAASVEILRRFGYRGACPCGRQNQRPQRFCPQSEPCALKNSTFSPELHPSGALESVTAEAASSCLPNTQEVEDLQNFVRQSAQFFGPTKPEGCLSLLLRRFARARNGVVRLMLLKVHRPFGRNTP